MGKSLFEDPAFLEALRMDCAKRGLRLDAGETAALSRQLEHMYAKTYDVKNGPLKSRQFVPIDTSVDTGAEFFTYRQWDMVGMADLIANFADDLPRVDAADEECVLGPRAAFATASAIGIADRLADQQIVFQH